MHKKGFRTSFTFGGLVAENDPLLLSAYWDNGDYDAIVSRMDPRRFLIGRTGSGKSAALRRLEWEYPARVIRIQPENLALHYITNLNVIPKLLELGVHLDAFLKALWKHVFMVEVLRHRYNITDPEQKQNIFTQLRERFRKDPGKLAALEYLSEFGDKFWCPTDERVKQVADKFEEKLAAAGDITAALSVVSAKASGSLEQTTSQERHTEVVARYQHIVNEVQIPKLNKMLDVLNAAILDAQHFTYLIIDDLDKDWVDERFANLLIRCLFNAVIDMQRVENLKIIVALRTNIFQQLSYDEHTRGGQEEKYRALALRIQWRENDLKALLNQRAEIAGKEQGMDPPRNLSQLLPKANKQAGDPLAYIMSRTLLRPRDAISYLNECIREAVGKEHISWEVITRAEKRYSQERLIALRDEWNDPYVGIDRLFEQFRRKPWRLTRDELTEILDYIAILPSDDAFRGQGWLLPLCNSIWAAGGDERSWYEIYGKLLEVLFGASFLGVVKGEKAIYAYNDAAHLEVQSHVPEGMQFEAHPAFRSALAMVPPR